jgi:AcrR family transcriptional regulator
MVRMAAMDHASDSQIRPPRGARPRGRPRLPDTDRRIIDAALKVLAEQGFARMSLEAVAAEAGVRRPTIYLRYRTKAELAIAALAASRDEQPPTPESGETRSDLVDQLRAFRAAAEGSLGMSLSGSVLAEEHVTPELLAHYRELIVRPRREMVRAVLERARARGELRPEADLVVATNALIGAYYAQYLEGAPFPDDWSERVVDIVLAGLLRSART